MIGRLNHVAIAVPDMASGVKIYAGALGAKVEVPTMTGKVQMTIPPGSQGGSELRLRGKGFPHLRGTGRGDQIVRIEIEVPKDIGMRGRDLLREFSNLTQQNPRLGRWN